MYDFPELHRAHDILWSAIAGRLDAAGVRDVPERLTRSLGHKEAWRHPRLLLSQGCEYPLATAFAGSLRLVATPRYAAAGCEGYSYRSAVVVRAGDCASDLAGMRERRCAINESDSNSGMNLLRAALAGIAEGGRPFFSAVILSGSHRRSAELVANGQADVAAIDCVTFAHLQRFHAGTIADLRVLCWTPSSPSLPFITAASTGEATLRVLRTSLADVLADNSADLRAAREELLLDGLNLQPDPDLSEVRRLTRQAAELGLQAVLPASDGYMKNCSDVILPSLLTS